MKNVRHFIEDVYLEKRLHSSFVCFSPQHFEDREAKRLLEK